MLGPAFAMDRTPVGQAERAVSDEELPLSRRSEQMAHIHQGHVNLQTWEPEGSSANIQTRELCALTLS